MSLPQTSRRLTEAKYLEIERAAEFKSEFFDGEMFAMAGGTPQHSLIGSNLIREFGNRLENSPCVAYNTDLKNQSGCNWFVHLSGFVGDLRSFAIC